MFILRLRLVRALAAVLFVLAFAARAPASLLMALSYGEILTVDPDDATILSTLSVDPSIQSITYDSSRGTLYGLSYKPSSPVELVKINRRTGRETLLGTLWSRANVGLINNPQGITSDPGTGNLYVMTYVQANGQFVATKLCTINPRTCEMVQVGIDLSWSENYPPPYVITTTSAGHVWVSEATLIWTVNPHEGLEAFSWTSPNPSWNYSFSGLAFEPRSSRMWIVGLGANPADIYGEGGTVLHELDTVSGQLRTIGVVRLGFAWMNSLTVIPGND